MFKDGEKPARQNRFHTGTEAVWTSGLKKETEPSVVHSGVVGHCSETPNAEISQSFDRTLGNAAKAKTTYDDRAADRRCQTSREGEGG